MPEDITGIADDAVRIDDLVGVFNSKGDAWGYSGPAHMKLGTAMLADLDLLPAPADTGRFAPATIQEREESTGKGRG